MKKYCYWLCVFKRSNSVVFYQKILNLYKVLQYLYQVCLKPREGSDPMSYSNTSCRVVASVEMFCE